MRVTLLREFVLQLGVRTIGNDYISCLCPTGVPQQSSQTVVKIQLSDTNSHSPEITFRYLPSDQALPYATVEENAEPGTAVASVTVTDKGL